MRVALPFSTRWRLRGQQVGCSSWLESSEEHLPTTIAGVLRLRAISRPLCDRSARRFAQDDGFVGVKSILLATQRTRKDQKVTCSPNDIGGLGKAWSPTQAKRGLEWATQNIDRWCSELCHSSLNSPPRVGCSG